MEGNFNLENYLSEGVENIVKGALKASLKNPKESLFMVKYAVASKKAQKLRFESAKQGEHVPPFLIASITSKCNLHCIGCYARCSNSCTDGPAEHQLTTEQWLKIFTEAKDMGVGFIILVGGEPLMRPDVISAAAEIQNILFPIFTNAVLITDEYIKLFEKYRNLFPVISIEGNEDKTDKRRGLGVYKKLITTMKSMKENKIMYGTSITVTKENLKEVTAKGFLDRLYKSGCKVIFYVEYVPADKNTRKLAPEDFEREFLRKKLLEIRRKYEDMLFISFPGDEKSSGGCIAAGRGFFHINYHGGAEPCPFSPYSDTNLKETSLKEAINSPLFKNLRNGDVLMEEHIGGCVLFEREETVQSFLQE